jgi:hypothetical protein
MFGVQTYHNTAWVGERGWVCWSWTTLVANCVVDRRKSRFPFDSVATPGRSEQALTRALRAFGMSS